MKTEFNKKALWLKPFLEIAKPHLPKRKLSRLRSVVMINPPLNTYTNMEGCMTEYFFENVIDILLYTGVRRIKTLKSKRFVSVKFDTMELLSTFAHELAHLKYCEHSPNHELLTLKIYSDFLKKLKRLGYKSLEDDPKNKFHEGL